MSDSDRPKLVIKIGAIQIEGSGGDKLDLDLTPARLLDALKAMRDELTGQGIDTTISVSNIDLDYFGSQPKTLTVEQAETIVHRWNLEGTETSCPFCSYAGSPHDDDCIVLDALARLDSEGAAK